MAHFELFSFLVSATGLLALISFCLLVFGRLGVGSIVAFLIAGLVAGQMRDLPPASVQALREFAELGVILLLFSIGLELQPSELRTLGREAIRFGAPQIAMSVGVIGMYVWGVFATWETAIVLGLGFTLSSTAVVVQLLKERNELHTSWGEKAFAILLAQDIAVVPFLLVVALISGGGAAGGIDTPWLWAMTRAIIVVVGIPVVGHFVLTRILEVAVKHKNEAAFACVTFLGVLAAALAAEQAGLSMALGTFLLGATLSVSSFGHRIAASVEPVKSILLALFFLSVGFSIKLETVVSAWAPLLFNILVILALKFGIVLLLAFAGGLPRGHAVRLSVALAQCGEFGFVLFGAAQAGGLMSPRLTALASILITISMLTTPFLLRLVAHWAPLGSRILDRLLVSIEPGPHEFSANQLGNATKIAPHGKAPFAVAQDAQKDDPCATTRNPGMSDKSAAGRRLMRSRQSRRIFFVELFRLLHVVWPMLSGILFAMVGPGLLIGHIEKWRIEDALYFTFVTGLTIGYGDLTPRHVVSRLLAVMIGFAGIVLTGLVAAVSVEALRTARDATE